MSWVEDWSGKLSVSGPEVRCTGEDEGGEEQAQALWSEGGTGYWEFKVGKRSSIILSHDDASFI